MKILFVKASGVCSFPVKVLISVPKWRFSKAVKRNLLKRRIREAYRLNKSQLSRWLNQKDISIHLAFVYNHKTILDYDEIEKNVKKSLEKIQNTIQNSLN